MEKIIAPNELYWKLMICVRSITSEEVNFKIIYMMNGFTWSGGQNGKSGQKLKQVMLPLVGTPI